MTYKNFRLNIIFRVLLLVVTIYILVHVIQNGEYYMTPFLFAILLLLQTLSLINYIEKTNRIVSSFLESIRFSDFSRTFQAEGLGSSFDGLKRSFNKVIEDFQKIRSEKEEHYFYLQQIISHVEIGILAYRTDGTVEMINNSAKKLFNLQSLKNIQLLETWSPGLESVFFDIKPGDNQLVKVSRGEDVLQLSIYATQFKINDREIILVSIKNIQSELEEQEMKAWQKLIRVLTHEIMNSIAPIASLTSTVNVMVKETVTQLESDTNNNIDTESFNDIIEALETIHKRSTGLIHFVEKYRNLTKIPTPNFSTYKIKTQFENIYNLLKKDIIESEINFKIIVIPEVLEVTADEQLIEQVLINLVKNSIHALENVENGEIKLNAYINNSGKRVMQIYDNGQGIIKEVGDKIFIPFFTTKTSGSGIGLSLSKQIMRQHGGQIKVSSEPFVETCFTLTFN
ncbi:MAG: ATP-binding protein [Bacteroidetes bacterium 4572_117]|nr:MAG: ATP-binding protein [Bacteroidetes bacterium 4572_117]